MKVKKKETGRTSSIDNVQVEYDKGIVAIVIESLCDARTQYQTSDAIYACTPTPTCGGRQYFVRICAHCECECDGKQHMASKLRIAP